MFRYETVTIEFVYDQYSNRMKREEKRTKVVLSRNSSFYGGYVMCVLLFALYDGFILHGIRFDH